MPSLSVAAVAFLVVALAACADPAPPLGPPVVVVTFNTGTNPGLAHDDPPDDGYGAAEAALSDQYYGDGLAWLDVIADARAFFAATTPDIVAFQEIFHAGDCASVPAEAQAGFVCAGWTPGAPTVTQLLLGEGYQIACHPGHADKCVAVRRSFGTLRGCAGDLCVDGMTGFAVDGCGGGARVARVVIDLVGGGELTVVNLHGTSGFADEDAACRRRQVEQVFVNLGDGAPGASGTRNLILGNLNTDPGRLADADESAARWNDFAGPPGSAHRFHFVTEVGREALPSYSNIFNIDHVVSDAHAGAAGEPACWHAGVTEGHAPVTTRVFFDHVPAVCTLHLTP